MKKFLITLPFMLFACKKSTTPSTPVPTFSVTASINGTPTSFNAIISVDSASTPGTVYIVAHADSTNLTPLFEITLTGKMPLTPGIYPFPDTISGAHGLLGFTGWTGDSDKQYNSISDTVNLTTVNKNWLAGTFQGACEYSIDSTIYITNGQFTVPISTPQ